MLLLAALALLFGSQHINIYARQIFGVVLFALSIRLLLFTYLSAIVIDEASITHKSWSGDKTLPLADLTGFRREGTQLFLVTTKDPALSIFGVSFYDHFDQIEAWASKNLPDLAATGLQETKKAIAANESLGSSAEDRLKTLKQAKITVGVYVFLGFAWCIFLIFVSAPWTTLITFGYLLVGVLLMVTGHKLIKFVLNPKQSPYPQIGPIWVIVAFVMLFKILSLDHIDDWTRTVYLSVGLSLLLFLLMYWLAYQKSLASIFLQVIIFLVISFSLSFGTILQCNCNLDSCLPQIYKARVLKMDAHHTGKGSTYFLTLSPWGNKAQVNKVDVKLDLYHQLSIGDSVQIDYWPGLLHIPWYRVLAN